MVVPLNQKRTWGKLLLAGRPVVTVGNPLEGPSSELCWSLLLPRTPLVPTAGHLAPETSLSRTGQPLRSREFRGWWTPRLTTGMRGIFCEPAYSSLVTQTLLCAVWTLPPGLARRSALDRGGVPRSSAHAWRPSPMSTRWRSCLSTPPMKTLRRS